MKHLSRFDIEAIAAKYVKAYMELPDVRNTKIYRIDPELLLEKVLGLTVEYQHLSYDGSILGMTSFTELGVQVLEDDDNEAFFFLDGKTVLVEKDLAFDNKLRGRKNFTLMHEGSHQIFKTLFPNDYGVTQKSSGIHEQFEKSEEPEVLLPHFSCHSLRHTFTTRMCEAGVNIKVIQDALGHTDISTTLNIYTDVTKELKTSEFKGLDDYFKAQ